MTSVAKTTKLAKELEDIVNRYSEENRSDTPDWILANYIIACLDAFNGAIFSREIWYGRKTAEESITKLNPREEAPELWKPSVAEECEPLPSILP
jgi:hypothetical protein